MTEGVRPVAKTPATESFPVASCLLPAAHRRVILAFYAVVRAADDVADDTSVPALERLAHLDALDRAVRAGMSDRSPDAPDVPKLPMAEADRVRTLCTALRARGVSAAPVHDLLAAFGRDVTHVPCADWAALRESCAGTAHPVGHFLLTLYGAPAELRPRADALCAGLQILNHLQDCGRDWRDMGRCYLPGDWLAAEGVAPEALGASQASPALRRVLDRVLAATDPLLAEAAGLPAALARVRGCRGLAAQAGATVACARALARRLARQDPLARRVTLGPAAGLGAALRAGQWWWRGAA